MTHPFLHHRRGRRGDPPRRGHHRRRRRGPRERGRLHLRGREGHARDRQLHDHPRPRAALHADPARGLPSGSNCRRWSRRTRPRWAPTSRCRSTTARRGPASPPRSGRRTIQAIMRPDEPSRPTSSRPGHLFPLVAKEGGVLRRAGHTEAAVDLARMAGPDAGRRAVRNPRRARRPRQPRRSCSSWPSSIDLQIISIEQLIRLSPRAREAGLSPGRGRAAHQVRHRPDHRLRREVRDRSSRWCS